MKTSDSVWNSDGEFMPPRAGRLSRFRLRTDRLRRQLGLSYLRYPEWPMLRPIAISLLVPGYGFYAAGRLAFGMGAIAAGAVLILVHFLFLGYPIAGVAFGLLVSLHVTGLLFLLEPKLRQLTPGRRILNSLLVVFVFWVLFYLPVRGWVQRHVFFPVRVEDRVMILGSGVNPATLRRGDLVAYENVERRLFEGILLDRGLLFGPVLAVPGDVVEFRHDRYLVNGQSHPSLPHMPENERLKVAENCWLIWPKVTISRAGYSEAAISGFIRSAAMVGPEQLRGKPLSYWFWRKQT